MAEKTKEWVFNEIKDFNDLKVLNGFRLSKTKMNSSLYIHVPFCKRLCGYCDFYKTMSLSRKEEYLRAAAAEMEQRQNELSGTTLQTVYLGGGTPSVLSTDEIGSLIGAAGRVWEFSGVEELTVEANPDDLKPDYLAALLQTGCNRLSIGIQSFRDDDLQMMNRRHNATEAVEAVENARRAGFDNISIDLIYGLPTMTLDEWRTNIATAIDLGVEHISAYHLTIEPQTLFARRGIKPIDERLSEEEYLLLHEQLTAHGYEHYEISNFALNGRRSRHNSGYWSSRPYLGIGPGAHSYDGARRRSWNPPSLDSYLDHSAAEFEELSDGELKEEYIMVRLRTSEGIDLSAFESRFGAKAEAELRNRAERFLADGTLNLSDGALAFNPRRWLVSDNVIEELFD